MSFERPITIKEATNNIHKKRYLLPAIQREFVWVEDQINKLFDSLMRGYPIGSFLFWQVEKENSKKFKFYEFIRNYNENNSRHNPKADISGDEDVTAILDGQQRLTALYIGLRGSVAYRLPRRWSKNPHAFPEKVLAVNLLTPPEEPAVMEYDFRFVNKELCENNDIENNNAFWFRVGNILDFKEPSDVNDFLIDNDLNSLDDKAKAKFANRTIFKLFNMVHQTEVINFFLEKDESLDKVLNIFIRVNSGGTMLSYSDLLLSIATAQWKNRDAREVIHDFVDDINKIGDGFNFDKDFVLKTCLVLCDFSDIAFKVDNFNSANMLKIESEWDNIALAIQSAVTLVSSLGYNRDNLTSNNAIIPIAYYLNKIGNPKNFELAKKYKNDRHRIFRWLTISLLKRVFGGQPDNVLRPIRQVIFEHHDSFPFDQIQDKLKSGTKSLLFTEDEIEGLLDKKWNQKYTFSVLSLLYPWLDYRHKFHVDHIFPRKIFTSKRLENNNVPSNDIDDFINLRDVIANLQLLEGVSNQEKSGKNFKEWLDETYPNEQERKTYMEKHFIPDVDLEVKNFIIFFNKRKELIRKYLTKLLMPNSQA